MTSFHSFCPLIKDACREDCMFYRSVTHPTLEHEYKVPKCVIYQALTPMAVDWEKDILKNKDKGNGPKF